MIRCFLFLMLLPLGAMAQTGVAFSGLSHDSSLPIELTSDRLNLNQAAGTALFVENVRAAQGSLRIAADKLLVEYVTEDGQVTGTVRQMTATGNVTLSNGSEAAEGAEAVYIVATGDVTMTGDVLLTQGQNALAGQRLVIDLDTGTAQIIGRVRTIFQTDSQQ